MYLNIEKHRFFEIYSILQYIIFEKNKDENQKTKAVFFSSHVFGDSKPVFLFLA